MNVLLDTCVWGGALQDLETAGHDVIWVGNWDEDPGDDEILACAYRERRILVTLDKDFGELAIVHRKPHCGIIRLVNLSATQQGPICLTVLKRYGMELLSGAIVSADFDRVRFRPPE